MVGKGLLGAFRGVLEASGSRGLEVLRVFGGLRSL